MLSKSTKDKLLVVWALKTLGWSYRRIARLFGHPKSTISDWYKQACQLPEADFSDIWPNKWRGIKIFYKGSSMELEKKFAYLAAPVVKRTSTGSYKQTSSGVSTPKRELEEVESYASKQMKDTLRKNKK